MIDVIWAVPGLATLVGVIWIVRARSSDAPTPDEYWNLEQDDERARRGLDE